MAILISYNLFQFISSFFFIVQRHLHVHFDNPPLEDRKRKINEINKRKLNFLLNK